MVIVKVENNFPVKMRKKLNYCQGWTYVYEEVIYYNMKHFGSITTSMSPYTRCLLARLPFITEPMKMQGEYQEGGAWIQTGELALRSLTPG